MKGNRYFATFSIALTALVTMTAAQTADKKTLTLKGAEAVITAAKAEAQKLSAPGGVIAVVDDGGNLIRIGRVTDETILIEHDPLTAIFISVLP